MIQFLALILLGTGGALEVCGVSFFGLDLLVGLCFAGAMALGGLDLVSPTRTSWGISTFGLAALALLFHIGLNCGLAG